MIDDNRSPGLLVSIKKWNPSLPCLRVSRKEFSRVNSVSFSQISLMQSESFRLFILDSSAGTVCVGLL